MKTFHKPLTLKALKILALQKDLNVRKDHYSKDLVLYPKGGKLIHGGKNFEHRTKSPEKALFMNDIEKAIYYKCMKLAENFARKKHLEIPSKKHSASQSFVINNPWVNLWSAFSKGLINEEETKACFLLGYLTTYAETVCAQFFKVNDYKKINFF